MSAPHLLGIPNGRFAENCWVVADPVTARAAVIDPGEEAERILAMIADRGWTVEQVWLTHAHIDHILGVDRVREATGAPVALHPADRTWYDALPEQAALFGLPTPSPLAPPDRDLVAGGEVEVGGIRFAVRHVPGHSPGHVAFVGHGLAISGDTLFAGSIGRTDLPGGDHAQLLASIRRELLSLPDATRVLPGHGPETTIGAERRGNPFLVGEG